MAIRNSSEPFTLGYYVFDLPNGQTLDLCAKGAVVLPEGDLSNLPCRYVERVIHPASAALPGLLCSRREDVRAFSAGV